MAFCVECGKQIEEGKLRCEEHLNELAATSSGEANQAPSFAIPQQYSQLAGQWLAILKEAFVNPLKGFQLAAQVPTYLFGLVAIVLGGIVKTLVTIGLIKEFASFVAELFSENLGVFGAAFEEGFYEGFDEAFGSSSSFFFKALFDDVAILLIMGLITLFVVRVLYKNSISYTQILSAIGIMQAYACVLYILMFLVGKLIWGVLVIPIFVLMIVIFPLTLHAYLRENGMIQPHQFYAVPLIYLSHMTVAIILSYLFA